MYHEKLAIQREKKKKYGRNIASCKATVLSVPAEVDKVVSVCNKELQSCF